MPCEVQVSAGAAYDLGYHVVWCPKCRPVLTGPVADRCGELIQQRCGERGWQVVALEVAPDHVHLFVEGHPADSSAHVANQLKGDTSRVLRAEFASLRSRLPTLWSRSSFAATVGAVCAATVHQYIDTQHERPCCKDGNR
ncbi:IS200/IS605 family transposase [Dactylosporangium cerinum]|uniref:IS200/IS605 family transposase n=1 Tax=Dactylosporangium cerinum TaxID=1434730 RepID=A0ABV9W1Y8_9ACTN